MGSGAKNLRLPYARDPRCERSFSEDPIQDGSNWYMAFGNDPVNYADPSGLSVQGYPLAGGFSGNKIAPKPVTPLGSFGSTTLGGPTYNYGTSWNSGFTPITVSAQPSFSFASLAKPISPVIGSGPLLHSAYPASSGPSLRTRTFQSLDDSVQTRTGYSAIDVPATFAKSVVFNAVSKPFVALATNWREDTKRERVEAVVRRNDAINGGRTFNTSGGLTQLYASATTDNIAFGAVGYDPVQERSLNGSERVTRFAGGTSAYVGTWIPIAKGANLAANAAGLPVAESSLGSARRVALAAEVEFQPYRNRASFSSPGQAHHLNPSEILGGEVAYENGVTTPLGGRAFADPGSAHFVTHRGLEAFFDQYRRGTGPGAKYPIGDGPMLRSLPTFTQYNRALYNSLQEGGVSSPQALRMLIEAKSEQLRTGFQGSDTIIRTPARMGQSGGP